MIHLSFGAVSLAFLVVLGRNLEVDVAKEPPVAESLGEVNATKPAATLCVRTRDTLTTVDWFERLGNLESMSLNRERVLVCEHVPRATGIFVLHPMRIDTLVL